MDKIVFDNTSGLLYELHGDYYLPCVTVPERKPVGIFGNRYRKHLKQHRNPIYTAMLLNGTLEDHVAEIDRQAEKMLDHLIKQMAEQEGINEEIKAKDQMAWVGVMNAIKRSAEEIINHDLIFD